MVINVFCPTCNRYTTFFEPALPATYPITWHNRSTQRTLESGNSKCLRCGHRYRWKIMVQVDRDTQKCKREDHGKGQKSAQ